MESIDRVVVEKGYRSIILRWDQFIGDYSDKDVYKIYCEYKMHPLTKLIRKYKLKKMLQKEYVKFKRLEREISSTPDNNAILLNSINQSQKLINAIIEKQKNEICIRYMQYKPSNTTYYAEIYSYVKIKSLRLVIRDKVVKVL